MLCFKVLPLLEISKIIVENVESPKIAKRGPYGDSNVPDGLNAAARVVLVQDVSRFPFTPTAANSPTHLTKT